MTRTRSPAYRNDMQYGLEWAHGLAIGTREAKRPLETERPFCLGGR